MFSLCSATSLGTPFMSECFHANALSFPLRKSTSALSYLGSSTVSIRSVRPSSEMTASLTSLTGSKEQAAHLDDSGMEALAWSLSDWMSASVN
jgi:hypothetical protein